MTFKRRSTNRDNGIIGVKDVTRYLSGSMAMAFKCIFDTGLSDVEDISLLEEARELIEDWTDNPDIMPSVMPPIIGDMDNKNSITRRLLSCKAIAETEWGRGGKAYLLTFIVLADTNSGGSTQNDLRWRIVARNEALPKIAKRIEQLKAREEVRLTIQGVSETARKSAEIAARTIGFS